MRPLIANLAFIIFGIIPFFYSCKKEKSCERCETGSPNRIPIAVAKPDTVIVLPTDSVLLDGSKSYDPDGTIINYEWSLILGPSASISQPSSKNTIVKNLVAGVYQFELKVTDNGYLFARDTATITVDATTTFNHPPIANAGPDQFIYLPNNNVSLNGSASFDPDNNIVSYSWTKISGPVSNAIVNPNSVQTQVNNLAQGVYLFELTVTDAGNLFSKDTMQVTVNSQSSGQTNCDFSNRPQIPAQLIQIGTLSQNRSSITVASLGTKILFAGGLINGAFPSSRVDIYDFLMQTWSTAELSAARYLMAAATNENKIFFGGGETGDGTIPTDSVDIYDISNNSWSTSHLSVAGNSIAAAAVGDKVLFAGGDGGFTGVGRETRVDIYNLTTGLWSTSQLSEVKRGEHAAVTVGNKVYIGGGETWPGGFVFGGVWGASNEIDIYDDNNGSWSSSPLIEGKLSMAAIAANGKIYWAGGETGMYPGINPTCMVEVMDLNSNSSTTQNLFKPGTWAVDGGLNAVLKDNKIIFLRTGNPDGNKFDIFDISTNTWSIGILPQTMPVNASIISVNNTIYIAASGQVYKLLF